MNDFIGMSLAYRFSPNRKMSRAKKQISADYDKLRVSHEIGLVKTCVFLPYTQVQEFQLPVHISYFLQKCKKDKPDEIDLPLLKIAHLQSGSGCQTYGKTKFLKIAFVSKFSLR
jgi:hypothetical protein